MFWRKGAQNHLLLEATRKRNALEVKKYIHGADLNTADKDGLACLHIAAANGDVRVAAMLIAAGANVNIPTLQDGATPLHIAATNGHSEVVAALIAAGASVNATSKDGCTPLYSAAANGHKEVLVALLAVGARVHVTYSKDGWKPLHIAAQEGHDKVAAVLMAAGAGVNAVIRDGRTALYIAAAKGHRKVAAVLMAAGANLNAVSQDGWTPLHAAAENGHKDMVVALVVAGANTNATQKDGWTPLHMAALNGHRQVAAALVTAGAMVDATAEDGRTPLQLAQEEGHVDVVEVLERHIKQAEEQVENGGGEGKEVEQQLVRRSQDQALALTTTAGGVVALTTAPKPVVHTSGYTGGVITLTGTSPAQASVVNGRMVEAGLTVALNILGAVVTANPLVLLKTVAVIIGLFETIGQDAMYCKRKAERVTARVQALLPLVRLLMEALTNASSPMELKVAQSIADSVVLLVKVLLTLRQLIQRFVQPKKAALCLVVDFLSSQGYKDQFDDLDAELQACLVQLNTLLSAAQIATKSASGGLSCATWRAEDREDHREDLRNLESQVLVVMGGVEGLQQQLVQQQEVVQGQVVTLQQVADWLQQMHAGNKLIAGHLARMEEKIDQTQSDVVIIRSDVDQVKLLLKETVSFMKMSNAQLRSKHHQPMFLISRSQIRIGEGALQRGSSGSYGTVVEAERDGGSVALKLYNYTKLREKDQLAAMKEALLLCRANHHNIVRCFGIVFDPDAPTSDSLQGSLVMEWVGGGSIYNWLQDDCPLAVRVNLLFQVSAGMRHLHQQRIIHGDLKPQNILVSSQQGGNDQVPQVKICDFGLAQYSSSTMTQSAVVTTCTVEYTSPQRLTDWQRSYKDDVYAFGILIHFVATADNPYSGISSGNMRDAVLSGTRPAIDVWVDEDWEDDATQRVVKELALIAKECWQANVEKRPTFDLLFDRLDALRTRL